jgi:hypothetical protein
MRSVLAGLVLVVACSGNAPPAMPDAPAAAAGTFGAACTMVSNTSTECQSGVCTDTVDMLGHPVCSMQCTFGNNTTCPAGSMGQKCNMKGYCRP